MPGYARPPQVIATGISVTPTGNLVSTDVQSALTELDSDLTTVDNELVYSSASPAGAAEGTLWVDSNTFTTYVNSASGWQVIGGAGGGATGGGDDEIFYENGQLVTTDYTISASANAMSTGPIEIASGVSVEIPIGSVWVIL